MAHRLDITVHKGRDFLLSLQLNDGAGDPIDITGATVESELRALDGTLGTAFTTAIVDAANGIMEISATAAATATLSGEDYFNSPQTTPAYIYDIVLTYSGGTVETVVEGTARVIKGVTE